MRVLLLLLVLSALPAPAEEPLVLRLTLVLFAGGAWTEGEAVTAAREAAHILGQCGIAPARMEIVRADEAPGFRLFHTPRSRALARKLQPRKPAVFFVDGTLQNPAYDAEAIGRGNSGSRPELANTVWVVHDARDPGVALAHELAHVLMDSGEHSVEPGNLMRGETTPLNTRLTDAQCTRLREMGVANGLLDRASR
ncbi:MAG TPA: hypothetical protein VMT02_05120 [Burkholderiales bacterium]|nr:hypothetical protein [Burkholderiales bacterium]